MHCCHGKQQNMKLVSLLSSHILYTKTSHGRVLKLSTSNHRVMYLSHVVDEIVFEAVQLSLQIAFLLITLPSS